MKQPRRPTSVPVELLRAVAWSGGLALIGLALLAPFAHSYFHVAPFREALTVAADAVVQRQQSELVRREQFAPEAAKEIAAADSRIEAEARVLADGRLLVRTMTSASGVADGWLPAMIYERTVDPDGEATEGSWLIDG